jgi:type IV pilus assembly protein PilP
MTTIRHAFLIILLLLLPFGMTNCKKPTTLQKNAQQAAKTQKKPALPKENVEEEEDPFKKEEEELFKTEGYAYEPGKRRDPFNPLVVMKEKETKKQVKKASASAPPLQSFDVTEFRLIATLSGKDGFIAMLKAPDNKAYSVSKGTLIGFNMGKITEINMSEVIVEELVENQLNKIEPRQVILKLRKEE